LKFIVEENAFVSYYESQYVYLSRVVFIIHDKNSISLFLHKTIRIPDTPKHSRANINYITIRYPGKLCNQRALYRIRFQTISQRSRKTVISITLPFL